jgi:ribonuclease HII
MEKHYYRNLGNECLESESPLNYSKNLTQEDKENLFKEIYSSMYLFNKIIYEVKKKSREA